MKLQIQVKGINFARTNEGKCIMFVKYIIIYSPFSFIHLNYWNSLKQHCKNLRTTYVINTFHLSGYLLHRTVKFKYARMHLINYLSTV